MEKIKLYHGTKYKYDKLDLSFLNSFSEGYGIYMTSSPSYAITYTGKSNNVLTFNINKPKIYVKCDEQSYIHEVEVPVNMISNEYTKHISIKDFYSLYTKHCDNITPLQEVDFTKSDFKVFNKIVEAMLLNIDVGCYASKKKRAKVLEDSFKFMVKHGYHVIKVEQPTRSMVKEFYLMLDVDLFNNGKGYAINEIK